MDYFRLFVFGLFLVYLNNGLFEIICPWIICGLFVLDYLRLFLDYLWIICCGLFVVYLKY